MQRAFGSRIPRIREFKGFRTRAQRASMPQRVFPVLVPSARPAVIELKFHDVDLNDTVVAATGTITPTINIIAQGVTESQRVGRKCTIKSINWRFQLKLPDATNPGSSADTVRLLMYLDKQANLATAAVTDIWEADDFQSFNNLSNKSRFRTLMDRTYDLNADISGDGTTIDTSVVIINDTFFKKVNIPIEFNSTAGAITEITSNNLGVLIISSQGLASFNSKIRLRFTDV